MKILNSIFGIIRSTDNILRVTDNGHLEHFLAGSFMAGVLSHTILKKTNNKGKAIFVGVGIASLVGLSKEIIDPYIGGSRSSADFIYTVFGGVVGATITILLKKKATTTNLKSV